MKSKYIILITLLLTIFCFFGGCATISKPRPCLTYLALKKPEGIIKTQQIDYEKRFNKFSIYLIGWFPPASDMASYIKQACQETGTDILRNTDIAINVPNCSLGMCGKTDTIYVGDKIADMEKPLYW